MSNHDKKPTSSNELTAGEIAACKTVAACLIAGAAVVELTDGPNKSGLLITAIARTMILIGKAQSPYVPLILAEALLRAVKEEFGLTLDDLSKAEAETAPE